MWEYLVSTLPSASYTSGPFTYYGYSKVDEQDWLDRKGRDGWSLVQIVDGKYYFKRIRNDPDTE